MSQKNYYNRNRKSIGSQKRRYSTRLSNSEQLQSQNYSYQAEQATELQEHVIDTKIKLQKVSSFEMVRRPPSTEQEDKKIKFHNRSKNTSYQLDDLNIERKTVKGTGKMYTFKKKLRKIVRKNGHV